MLTAQHWGPMPRLLISLPTATVTTLCLLFLMARLIYMDTPPLDPEPYPSFPPVVMEPAPPEPPAIKKPERVKQPEPIPERLITHWEPSMETEVSIPRIKLTPPTQTGIGAANSLPFARVMAPPVYPFRAANRGIEGFVDLRFDITATGATRNIQVTHAEPEGVFEQSALTAVARWRFQPKMVNGKPEPFIGLSKRVRFTLEK